MKLPTWYDGWLTHDAAAEEMENFCEICGEDFAVSIDPEGSTVYCRNCEQHTTNETSSKKTTGAATASTNRHPGLGTGDGGRSPGV